MAQDENPQEQPVTQTSSEILVNMEGLIKGHITAIDKISKEAVKVKQGTKAQILRQPQAGELDKKVKELKADLKENRSSLSDYLQEYARLSGVNEIEGDDGEVREIVYDARLIKKSSIFA